MLILGAQILLGFEFRAAFSDGFDQIPSYARHLEALALMLMVTSVALMITPGPYHRIVEGGRDSGAFHNVTAVIANLSLLPFALALGIDVFVSIERICGSTGALAAGIGAAAVALALWYGMPRVAALSTGQKERAMTERQRTERPSTPLGMSQPASRIDRPDRRAGPRRDRSSPTSNRRSKRSAASCWKHANCWKP